MKRQPGGFALILVIWALLLLTGLATGFAYAVRTETRTASDLVALAHAEAASLAALHRAVMKLAAGGPAQRVAIEGGTQVYVWQQVELSVTVQPESGLIDLNQAPAPVLRGLFEQLFPDADAAALADAVVDWRDPDDRPQPSGAESDDYAHHGRASGPAQRPFRSVNELAHVLGFDGEMVRAATPSLTVYSRRPKINPLAADLIVLAAIPGITRLDAESFVMQRQIALAEGMKPNLDLLRNGRRHLDTRARRQLLSVDIDARLPDGYERHERVVIRLDRARGYELLYRETGRPTPRAILEP